MNDHFIANLQDCATFREDVHIVSFSELGLGRYRNRSFDVFDNDTIRLSLLLVGPYSAFTYYITSRKLRKPLGYITFVTFYNVCTQ